MKTFKSNDDLRQLSPNDPAFPVVSELVRVLIDAYGESYKADDYGYIVLIEDDDQDQYLTEIDWPEFRLVDIPWEGITWERDHYVAIVLCNNEYGLVFVIPDRLVSGELEECILEHLDPPREREN